MCMFLNVSSSHKREDAIGGQLSSALMLASFPLGNAVTDGVCWNVATMKAEVGGSCSSHTETSFEVATHLGVWVTPLL